MTTFALVGAGPGLGLAAARRFGAAGHRVALLSRSLQHQDDLVAEPARENVHARGFTADVLDPASLAASLHEVADTLPFVNGSSAVRPNPERAGTSIAFAAESAYAAMLHDALADQNIHAAQLIIPGAIRPDAEHSSPDALAERLYAIHTERGGFRHYAEPMPT
ncbi:SDR family NAD(P)-dependent oxidoreductase [Streptomyces sp. NPDC013171]|uniref:SDR family NAD(P)-dependent oxidoreductase n=1 Tax=Streptomyces sp. NPDC013171 TaxID=3364863 RepID=UPI0036B987F7